MKEPVNNFGRELRRLRREGTIKYSLAKLASLSGVSACYISKLETGDRKPTVSVIRKLSSHLGKKPNHLLQILGMTEMDFAATFANNLNQVKQQMSDLPEDQIEEIADYLTYLEFKASIHE
ncbi:MAG: helix-turn-helix transcriptional regulator [Dehalococcoidales bacterium]|jgi:transcriptional regulator with XRE-family HTH domain